MATKVKTGVLGTLTELNFADSGKAQFGTGPDLQIYHDGSNARIRELTGELRLQTTSGGVNALVAKSNAAVEIFHAGSKKLETTSTGINITGSVTADDLRIDDGDIRLYNNSTDTLIFGSGLYQTIAGSSGSNDLNYRTFANHIFKTATGASSKTDGTERMRIDSAGTLYLGCTSPTLHSAVTGIVFTNGSLITDSTRIDGGAITLSQNLAVDSGNTYAYLAAGEASYYQQFNGNHYFTTAASGSAGNDATMTTQMTIHSDSDVTIHGTIGTNSSTAFASMGGRLQFDTDYSDTQRGPNKIVLQEDGSWIAGMGVSNGATDFYTGGMFTFSTGTSLGTERMRLNASGKLLLGTTTDSIGRIGTVSRLGVVGGTNSTVPVATIADQDTSVEAGCCLLELSYQSDTSFSEAFYLLFTDPNGTQGSISGTGNQTVSFNTSSDKRLKENIVDTESQLEKIKQIEVRDFNYIGNDKTTTGMIAQELNTIIPNVVVEGGEDVTRHPWSIDYGKLTPYLIKAIQEQQEQIEELKAKLESK